ARLRAPLFLFHHHTHPRLLHSFPTRRSSDLAGHFQNLHSAGSFRYCRGVRMHYSSRHFPTESIHPVSVLGPYEIALPPHRYPIRSEEHTSELQSRVDLVCRLLLEKKKHIKRN